MNENSISVEKGETRSSRAVTRHCHTDGISAVNNYIMQTLSRQLVKIKEVLTFPVKCSNVGHPRSPLVKLHIM